MGVSDNKHKLSADLKKEAQQLDCLNMVIQRLRFTEGFLQSQLSHLSQYSLKNPQAL